MALGVSWVFPLHILALGDPGSCRCISLLYVGGCWDLVVVYHGFRCVSVCVWGGGGVLGLAVVYHGFIGGPVSCRCVSWLYWEGGGGPVSNRCISWL